MRKKLLFIFNPYSGRGQIKDCLVEIIDIMVKADYDVVIYTTQSRGDATRKVREEAQLYDLVVCSGGDGTLDEVATGMMFAERKVPIGYIPTGSTNDFGSSLGITKSMKDAALTAVSGQPFRCDVGRFGEDVFVYVAAFGAFTEVSYLTPQETKNALGHAAYILEGAKQLANLPVYSMQVEYGGNVLFDEYILGLVTNSKQVGGFKDIIPGDIELNDGIFEVTLIKAPENPAELNEILAFIGFREPTHMVTTFQTSEVRFVCSEPVPWTLDGEYGGDHTEILVRNEHDGMEIMVESDTKPVV